MNEMIKRILQCVYVVFGLAVLGACSTSSTLPAQSYDGLELVPDTRFGAVYLRPGAKLDGFEAYGVAGCQVAFRKNWMRNQNNTSMNLSSRVTQKDVDQIKDSLGRECDKYLKETLEAAPPYKLVDAFSEGENVLILRPAIVNLDISAPDTNSTSMSRVYTTSAGEMTLLLEMVDGTTGEVLVRIVDRRQTLDTSRLQWSNSVTNTAEARRILKRWMDQLRKGMDEVTDHAGSQS